MRDAEYRQFMDGIGNELKRRVGGRLTSQAAAKALAVKLQRVEEKIAPLRKERDALRAKAHALGVEIDSSGEISVRTYNNGAYESAPDVLKYRTLRTELGLARLSKDQKKVSALIAQIATLVKGK